MRVVCLSYQIHLDTLPEMIARALRSQLHPEVDSFRPNSAGHITPSASSGPRPLSDFTGMRQFAGTARQRRPFQTQASFGGFSNVAEQRGYSVAPPGGANMLTGPPQMGSDSQL